MMLLLPSIGALPRLLAGAAAAALLATSAVAAEPAKKSNPTRPAAARKAEPPAPAAKPAEPLLTRDQLKACMDLKASNKAQGEEVTRMHADIQAQTDAVKRDGEALRADLATLDRTNADAVSAYNQRTADRNRQVADFEVKVSDFNAKVKAFDDARERYIRDCDNRKYDEKDEKALLKAGS